MFAHEKILKLPAVIDRTGLTRSTIYRKIQEGSFPAQIHLGERSTGWVESEIDAWINQRIAQSRAGKNGVAA